MGTISESPEVKNPLRDAFERVLQRFQNAGSEDSRMAMMYLDERITAIEKTLSERNRAFKPPTPQEVTEYAKSIKFDLDGRQFCDFYETRNWFVGKVKMRNWKAAVRTWSARRNDIQSRQPTPRIPDNLRTEHGL